MSNSESEDGFDSDSDEEKLPFRRVAQLMRQILPREIRCSTQIKELVVDCCTEFVHLVSAQASEICLKSKKKIISGDHVVSSVKELGFPKYTKQLLIEKKKYQTFSTHKRRLKKKRSLDVSDKKREKLQREQERLFNNARMNFEMNEPNQNQPSEILPSNTQVNFEFGNDILTTPTTNTNTNTTTTTTTNNNTNTQNNPNNTQNKTTNPKITTKRDSSTLESVQEGGGKIRRTLQKENKNN
ncbi:protein dr1 [Anaeramoeba flamelloides]|uniref:Protein dr1 n=1 Tax=Anaeramoeba flamelloides TaxID=1746091 RepID=A0AAV7YJR6_9EUKA|nr:protein dr1 [Anaeramoeba flamelloides]